MKYRQIIEIFQSHAGWRQADIIENALEYICKNFAVDETNKPQLKQKLRNLYMRYEQKWQLVSRHKNEFESNNAAWLETEFELSQFIHAVPVASTSRGRPSKDFEDLSDRSKRRKINDELISPRKDTIEKALLGARRTAYNKSNTSMVKVIGHILRNRDQAAKMYATLSDSRGMLSDEEAFEYFLDCDMTKYVYEQTHKKNPARFPSYKVIQKMKTICSPPQDSIEKTSTKIKVNMQSLMKHTAERIVKLLNFEINKYMDDNNQNFIDMMLLSSWGMDGSTGYSQYHQKFSSTTKNSQQDDSDVFSVTTTPIHLYLQSDRQHIFWHNLTPQSVRYCRPIMLEFVKESKKIVVDYKGSIEKEQSELVPVKIDLEQDRYVLVDFVFIMSMVDGKVLNYITDTSSMQNCPICKATPNAMTSLEELEKGYVPEEETLLYGICPLHAWMRFFECLLHISYRIDLKKWQVSKDLKEKYLKRKQLVQNRLYESLGIRVDQPRQGGAGSSTTGNVCRRAFSNPKLLSKALDVNEELIKRFWNILIAINCQEPVNPEKLDTYCKETYRLYLQLYDWYKMPATVHKVLAHAGDIIIHSPAPLGMLAEEAAECQHKMFKKSRTHHARKTSREDNLLDVFVRAMNASDPLISALNLGNRLQNKSNLEYPEDVQSFLVLESSASVEDPSAEQNALEELLMDLEEVNVEFAEDENVYNE